MSLKTFTAAYIEAALWSSTDESNEQGGEPLDKNYGPDDITPDTQKQMEKDCREFYRAHNAKWSDDSYAGHDFWLTRNHHGAGFWDGDYPEPQATELTDAANAYGSFGLYVGYDGKVHGS